MTPDRWQKVEELFHAALALAPDERSGYLLRVCPDDADLRAEVEALIREHIEDPSFLGEPVAMVSDGADGPESEGEEKRIGPYALIRTLGTGGMGEVFRQTRGERSRTFCGVESRASPGPQRRGPRAVRQ